MKNIPIKLWFLTFPLSTFKQKFLQSAFFPVPSVVSRIDTPPQINNAMITVPLH